MELRQLEAFAAVAAELHFGRAAERLLIGQPTLSETIRRLERELGTPLFVRTTRQVALTPAGSELLVHATAILDRVAVARRAVRRAGAGDVGTVRLGITPPVAPVLAPHLVETFRAHAPHVVVEVQQMWLPRLLEAVASGSVDVAITCGLVESGADVVGTVFCAESLLVGLRASHRLAGRDSVALEELAEEVLGAAEPSLFPAWALCQQQALDQVGLAPPSVALLETDLGARRWIDQESVDWVMLVASLVHGERPDAVVPVQPEVLVPYTVQWAPAREPHAAVVRFVDSVRTAGLPPGWRRP